MHLVTSIRSPWPVAIVEFMQIHDGRENPIVHLGDTNTRPPPKRFGIRETDRAFHMHVVGKTGTGKSTLLLRLMEGDIARGHGLTFIDPHGDTARRVFRYARAAGRKDVHYVDAAAFQAKLGYNPLKQVSDQYIPLAVSGLIEVFKKRFPEAWGIRMEHIFRNALYAILDTGGGTLLDVLRIFQDKDYREDITKRIRNEVVREFWQTEFASYSDRYKADATAPIQNKIGAFLSDPRMRSLLTNPAQELSFRRIMDEGGIIIVNLSRGTVGEDGSSLLGALLVTSIALAGYSRDGIPEDKRRRHYLYVDEFQAFTTQSVADMIGELRKYRLSLVLAHQHLSQLDEKVRHAVIGNVGTLIALRLGAEDAHLISREFMEEINERDLISLPNYTAYIRLMINGEPCLPFRMTMLPGK